LSNYSIHYKIGTIYNLIDRAILSHPKFYQKNSEFIITTLLNNRYISDLIFNKITKRIKKLFDKFYSEKVISMIFFLQSQYHIFMIYKQTIQFILTLK